MKYKEYVLNDFIVSTLRENMPCTGEPCILPVFRLFYSQPPHLQTSGTQAEKNILFNFKKKLSTSMHHFQVLCTLFICCTDPPKVNIEHNKYFHYVYISLAGGCLPSVCKQLMHWTLQLLSAAYWSHAHFHVHFMFCTTVVM